jgi:hypothetical protein
MIAPQTLYPNAPEYIVVLFDVRIPGVAERLHSERAAHREFGDIEAVDEHHFALLIRPGSALEEAA